MWAFEMYLTDMDFWHPMVVGEESAVREQYDWYVANRPDLGENGQLRLRQIEDQ